MLFHTWTFLVFLLVVLSIFFALRKTSLWLPWLTLASYFFYGWWNPYYLILVVYSTLLDFSLVALMDHCPATPEKNNFLARLIRPRFEDGVLRMAFFFAAAASLAVLIVSVLGPKTLRPTLIGFGFLLFLMAVAALYGSRRLWLLIRVVNTLALLAFFKFAWFF